MSELNDKHRMTPEQLENIGKALYGSGYKIQLAEFLGVDRRRINHWLDGDRPIPAGITKELLANAKSRENEVREAIEQLNKILSL